MTASALAVHRHPGRLRRRGGGAPGPRPAPALRRRRGRADRRTGAGRRGRLGQLRARRAAPPAAQAGRRRRRASSLAAVGRRGGLPAVPWSFPIAAFAVLPLRVPVQRRRPDLAPPGAAVPGDRRRRALLRLRGDARPRSPRTTRATPRPGDAARLARGRLAAAARWRRPWCCTRSRPPTRVDVSNAIENASFFLVPFALAVRAARRGPLDARGCSAGSWSRSPRSRLSSPRSRSGSTRRATCSSATATCSTSNQLHLYFRVNSLFYDPNILGRYLALVDRRARRRIWPGRAARALAIAAAVVAGVLLAALALSFSITELRRAAGRAARRRGASVGRALGRRRGGAGDRWPAAALVFAGERRGRSDTELDGQASTTSPAAGSAWSRAASSWPSDRPIVGLGIGLVRRGVLRRTSSEAKTTVSHTEPITVAAEQGAIGLIVYLALRGARAWSCCSAGRRASVGAAAVAACFVAMLVHSLGYAAFTIDPATWALLGSGCAAARRVAAPSVAGRGAGIPTARPAASRRLARRDVRVPAPAGDDRRRLHGLERALEADRGLPAADLHALPDAERLRRGGGDARLGDRREHRRPARGHRGDPALLLPRRTSARGRSWRPGSPPCSGARRSPRASRLPSPSRSPRRCSTTRTPGSRASRSSASGR